MKTEKPLIYYLGQTVNLLKCQLISRMKERNIDLSIEHFIILNLVSDQNGLTQQDIADHFQKDKSLVLRQVNTLLQKGFLKREIDLSDKRKKNLIITPLGEKMMHLARKESMDLSNQLLHNVSAEELSTFLEVIKKIQVNTGLSDKIKH